jgi:hypothetical protein
MAIPPQTGCAGGRLSDSEDSTKLGAYTLAAGCPSLRMAVTPDPCVSRAGVRSVYEALMGCHYARCAPPPPQNSLSLSRKGNVPRPPPGSSHKTVRVPHQYVHHVQNVPPLRSRAHSRPPATSLFTPPHRSTRHACKNWRRAVGYSCFLSYVLVHDDKEAAAGTATATIGTIAESASQGAQRTWIAGMDLKTRATIKDSHDREPGMGMICPSAPRMARPLRQAIGGWKVIHHITGKAGMDWTGGRKVRQPSFELPSPVTPSAR